MREIRDTLRPHIGVRLPVGAGWHSYISVPVDEYRALERDLAAAKEVSLEANERAKKAEVMSVAARVLLKEDGEMEEKLAKADAKIVELETKLDAAELKAAVPWTKGRAIDHQSCGQTAAKFLKRAVAAETEGVELKTRIAMLEGNLRVAVKESLDRALGKKAAETELAALREKDSK
jgi:pseudouridine-5'-phosphate glycosidase